MDSVSGRA